MEKEKREEVKKEAEEIWENNLKKIFDQNLKNYLIKSLTNLQTQLKNFDDSMMNHIQTLNKNFNQKFDNQISQLKQEGFINKNVNINNINNNKNNSNMNNNNLNNNNINNINNNIFNINEIFNENESDEMLRKINIDIKSITAPLLKRLNIPQNSNPLINLILNYIVNIKTLLLYYFNPNKQEKIMWKSQGNPNKLGQAFLKLLDHFWKSKNNEYTPSEIHKILKDIMKNDYNTQNPGLIFKYFLTQLNSELQHKNTNEENNIEEDPYLFFNREKVIESFIKKNQNPTKISNCFYNMIETEKRCDSCGTVQYSIENIPIINIYLQANEGNIYNNISFNEHFKSLLLDKNKDVINEKCMLCETEKNKYISKHILDVTDIFIININRNNDPNNIVEFKYPEKIEKKDFINQNKINQFKDVKYELFCIIKNYKLNNNSNFVMFCKNFVNNEWYSYNNKHIKKSDINEAISDGKNTCLIIYKNINILI